MLPTQLVEVQGRTLQALENLISAGVMVCGSDQDFSLLVGIRAGNLTSIGLTKPNDNLHLIYDARRPLNLHVDSIQTFPYRGFIDMTLSDGSRYELHEKLKTLVLPRGSEIGPFVEFSIDWPGVHTPYSLTKMPPKFKEIRTVEGFLLR